MVSTYFRLTRIAKFCKKNYEENEKKRKRLELIWTNEQAYLITKNSRLATEKSLAKEQKLINFDPDLRKEILNDYLDRCKLRHSNLYYQWRAHFEGNLIRIILKNLYH